MIFILPLSTLIAQAPSSVLPDIAQFKIDFPLDGDGDDYAGVDYDDRDDPLIKAATRQNLSGYTASSPFNQYFFASGNEVVFRAHCAGALTSANSYPRCELRERVNGGDDLWEFDDEHELNATFRITKLPNVKKEVCVLQIKGNDSNNTSGTEEALRLEYREGSQGFHIEQNESSGPQNILSYSLGQTVKARLYVNNGRIYINLENLSNGDTWSREYDSDYSHGYFKAGCYTQSSIWGEKNGIGDESPNAYGEVRFSQLVLGGASPPPTSTCTPTVPSNRVASNVTTSGAKLNWSYNSNMDHYNARYRKVGNSNWIYKTTIRAGNVSISGLSSNTNYEWQVRAKCEDGSGTTYGSGQGANFSTDGSNGGGGDTENLALRGSASQSSTGYGGIASRAIDNNTNGNWTGGSITHTNNQNQPWWQVKLQSNSDINQIKIFNRTNCCVSRLSNFTVTVLNDNGGVVWSNSYSNAPTPSLTINLSKTGRTVRINLNGTNPLSLAEVQVFGTTNDGDDDDDDDNDYSVIQAEDYDSESGVRLSNGGNAIGYIGTGDWAGYEDVNSGAKSITLNVSKGNSGTATIEIRKGSKTGTKIGEVSFGNTGGWTSFKQISTNISQTSDSDLYLVFEGNLDVDWFQLSSNSAKVHQQLNGIALNIAPNPFTHYLTVEMPEDITSEQMTVQLTDISGRVVFERNNLSTGAILTINEDLPQGVYIVKWSDEKNQLFTVRKVVKQ